MAESGLFLSNYPAHRRLLQLARQLYSLQKQTMIPESTHLHCVGGITHTVNGVLTILQNYFRDSLRRTVGIMVSPQWLSMTGMFHTLKKATMLLLLFTSQNQAQV